MKHLNDILESIFDIEGNTDQAIIDSIHKFIKDNYTINAKSYTIHNELVDGKYVVDAKAYVNVKNTYTTTLTNGSFRWGEVDGSFNCGECNSLTSLEGAPKKVGRGFYCSYCKSLKTLEGAPEEVGGDFYCSNCESLTSLEGAPKKVRGHFDCGFCYFLKSLEGAPKEVGGYFSCIYCNSLKTFKGAPKKVGGDFYCNDCASIKDKTIDSVVKGEICC